MKTEYERKPDILDVILAMNRQMIIIEMLNSGQLDPESAGDLFASTTRPDVVAEDRFAAEKGEMGPDSPTGRLGTLLFKLARRGQK